MKRTATVFGTSHYSSEPTEFRGKIEFELREDVVYYTWRIDSAGGDFLGSKSQPMSLRTIPRESDPFKLALVHAVESIKRYRVNRVHVFKVFGTQWEDVRT